MWVYLPFDYGEMYTAGEFIVSLFQTLCWDQEKDPARGKGNKLYSCHFHTINYSVTCLCKHLIPISHNEL